MSISFLRFHVIRRFSGTNQWRGKGGYEKLPRSIILQMTGRAGRPGFDTSGVAVIMTSTEDKEYYERRDMDIVESVLPGQLIEGEVYWSYLRSDINII